MNTILLSPRTWDLLLDASANIAMASDPYAVAQDVASACLVIQGELVYNTSQGIPYFNEVMGAPPLPLLEAYFNNAARTVPTVVASETRITNNVDRVLTGEVTVTTPTSTVRIGI